MPCYKLVNSATKEVIYIGHTKCSLKERLRGHLAAAKKGTTPIAIYIRSCPNFRKVIKIVLIINKRGDSESGLIAKYGKKHKLLNVMSLYSHSEMVAMYRKRKAA